MMWPNAGALQVLSLSASMATLPNVLERCVPASGTALEMLPLPNAMSQILQAWTCALPMVTLRVTV
jgi:hypothetical protein